MKKSVKKHKHRGEKPEKKDKKKLSEKDKLQILKQRTIVAMVVLVAALIVFLFWLFFLHTKPCGTVDCFFEAVENCKRVSWMKEDAQATWLYTIEGSADEDRCEIKVELVKMKEGTIDSEKLQGKTMTCNVLKGEVAYPEKDTSRCSGPLKEELQDIIIQRLHSYILENVGEIRGSL